MKTRLAARTVLVVVAAVLVTLAFYLSAPLADWLPMRSLVAEQSWALRALLAAAVAALLVVLVALAWQRPRQRWLRLRAARGAVAVAESALRRQAEAAASADPDVVRAEVALRVKHDAARGRVKLVARPLTNADGLSDEVRERVAAELETIIGAPVGDLRVVTEVLNARQLSRRLPG